MTNLFHHLSIIFSFHQFHSHSQIGDWIPIGICYNILSSKIFEVRHDLCIHGVVGRQELANAKEALATELQQTSNGADDADAALRTAERRMRVTRQGLREQQEKMEEREANLMLGYFLGERKCVG